MRLALLLLVVWAACHGAHHDPDVPLVGAGMPTVCGSSAGFGLPSVPWPEAVEASQTAIVDLDGDGASDIVVLGFGVATLRGHGDGTFDCRVDHVAGALPVTMLTGDLNRDGHPDVVTVNRGPDENSPSLAILLGTGTGDLTAPTHVALDELPGTIAIGDLDEDGAADLVMTTSVGVSVLRNHGDASFDPPTVIDVGGTAGSVAIGDFDASPGLDLAVTYQPPQMGGSNAPPTPPFLALLSGNAHGAFRDPIAIPITGAPSSLTTADVDGDGRTDLVMVNAYGIVATWLQRPGGFTWVSSQDQIEGPAVVGDLDRDGHADLISFTGDGMRVDRGQADGSFLPGLSLSPIGVLGAGASLDDVNGDGLVDLVYVGDGFGRPGNAIAVLLGRGDGSFVTSSVTSDDISGENFIAADFDEDGELDVITTINNSIAPSVRMFRGDGLGGFTDVPSDLALPGYFTSLSTGDIDGDGHADLVTTDKWHDQTEAPSVEVLRGHGDGTFEAAQSFPISDSGWSTVFADLNGDGHLDVIVAVGGNFLAATELDVLLGNGDGTLQPARAITPGRVVVSLAMADVDRDRHADIVAGTHGDALVFLGNGDGTFQAPLDTPVDPLLAMMMVSTGDLDGDGNIDLVAGNLDGLSPNLAGKVAVLRGNGDGTFASPTFYENPADEEFVAMVDLDRDGHLDVLTTGGVIGVLRGLGDGTLARRVLFGTPPSGVGGVVTADIDHDGKLDVVTMNGTSIDVALQRALP
jgi:hypothetical protein